MHGRGPAQKRGRGRPAPGEQDDDVPRTLAEAYRRHAPFVWRILRHLGVPDATREDMLHDVFMVVHRRLDEYDGRAAMTTWLYNVARGVVSNDRRGRTREARRVQLVQPEPAPAPDPEEALGRSEAARFVEGFLAGLDAPKREMFELVDVDGLTVPAAARICNTNLNTAYSRLRAARNEFQQAVGRRAPHPSRRVSG